MTIPLIMTTLLDHPTPGVPLASFAAGHFVCTATLGFTTGSSTFIRRFASILVFLFTLLGDRTTYVVSDNASIRCLLVTFSWVQAFNAHALLSLSKTEYKISTGTKTANNASKSIFVGHDDECGDGSFWSRLAWALAMQWNLRRIRTSRPARGIPPFSSKDKNYIPKREKFVLNRVGIILASMGYMVVIGLQPEPTFDDLSITKIKFFSRLNEVTPNELLKRAVATGSWIVGIGATSEICYNAIAIVLVGLGLSEPVMWPSWFGSFKDAYSVRNWWGISWQQTWQRFLADHADWVVFDILHLPKSSPIARYSKYLVVFYISGLLHLAPDLAIGMPLSESPAILFFTFQTVGIMIETAVQSLNHMFGLVKNDLVARTIGYVWLGCWLVWTVPWWSFVCTRHMQAGQDDLMSLARGNSSKV